MANVVAVVGNYNFTENAVKLKTLFSRRIPTLLLDSGSDEDHPEFDVRIRNDLFGGQWNTAVSLALERDAEWLLFSASDVDALDGNALLRSVDDCVENESIGVWTPSLRPDSRASFHECVHGGTNALRDVVWVEFFFFLARLEVLRPLHPVDLKINRPGWNIDMAACHISRQSGLRVVVDDRCKVFHPTSVHRTANLDREAKRCAVRYRKHLARTLGLEF